MATMLAKNILTQVHPYTQDIRNYQLLSLIDDVFDSHKSKQAEVRNVGDTAITWDTSVLFNQLADDFHILVIIYDISDLINVKQMQIDFLRNASHELKTPITAISGFTKTLLDGAMNDKKSLVEFLKIIDQQSEQLASLVQDVLTISHIQNGQNDHYQVINLKTFVESQLKSYKSTAAAQRITINNHVAATAQVTADANTLTRVWVIWLAMRLNTTGQVVKLISATQLMIVIGSFRLLILELELLKKMFLDYLSGFIVRTIPEPSRK